MHGAVEIVHHEGTENSDLVFMSEVVELILEIHTSCDVPALPQDVDHLAPPTNLRVTPTAACLRDHIRREAEEYGCIRHGVAHELRKQLVGVNDRELSRGLGGSS